MRADYVIVVVTVGLAGMIGAGHLGEGMARSIVSAPATAPAFVVSRQAGAAETGAHLAEGLRAGAEVPRGVVEHFERWEGAMRATATVDEAALQRIDAARKALSRRDLRDYLRMTIRGGEDPDRGFAVALTDLPGALARWHNVQNPYAETAEIRALMEPNLRMLDDAVTRFAERFAEDRARWAGAQRETADQLEIAERNLLRAQRTLHRTLGGASLSKMDTANLLDQVLGALNFEDVLAPGKGYFARRPADLRRLFPLLSDTHTYWDFSHVPAWYRAGAFPAETPLFTKAFGGVIAGMPTDFAYHDASHIRGLLLRAGDPAVVARWRGLLEIADGAAPDVAQEIRAYVGESMWDGEIPLVRLGTDGGALSETSRRAIAEWFVAHGTEEQKTIAQHALDEIPPGAL